MNPPNDQDRVLALYIEGPSLLERALDGLQDADLDTGPSQGGWTIRQIVHHIADGDDIWKMGIKAALGDEQVEFAFDWYRVLPQEVWADRWAYAKRSLDVSLALLKVSRDNVVQLLEQVPEGWQRSVEFRKPDGETVQLTVGTIVEMQANHVVHHANRILAIRQEIGRA
jgi:uncharacterized damage-inducible protein DinB